jgi:uncharacterized damage-inducible protein DinB
MDLLDRMLEHDRWTTAGYLQLSQGLTDAQLDQPFDIGLGTLRQTFGHMIGAVGFWMAALTGNPAAMVEGEAGQPAIALLTAEHERSYDGFADFARRARDEQRLDDTFIDFYGYPQSIGATILQVVHHNAQHRAEVRHMLQRLGFANLRDGDPQEWEHLTGRI